MKRWWTAEALYSGHEPFWFGSVEADGNEDALAALMRLWSELSPHPAPRITAVVPGQLVLKEA